LGVVSGGRTDAASIVGGLSNGTPRDLQKSSRFCRLVVTSGSVEARPDAAIA
jgi:hypothetical protein